MSRDTTVALAADTCQRSGHLGNGIGHGCQLAVNRLVPLEQRAGPDAEVVVLLCLGVVRNASTRTDHVLNGPPQQYYATQEHGALLRNHKSIVAAARHQSWADWRALLLQITGEMPPCSPRVVTPFPRTAQFDIRGMAEMSFEADLLCRPVVAGRGQMRGGMATG